MLDNALHFSFFFNLQLHKVLPFISHAALDQLNCFSISLICPKGSSIKCKLLESREKRLAANGLLGILLSIKTQIIGEW